MRFSRSANIRLPPPQTRAALGVARWEAHFPSSICMRRRPKRDAGHDQGYKRLFSHPLAVEDLLAGLSPADWTGRLDFSTLERWATASSRRPARAPQRPDLAATLNGEGGGWFYLYLLLEFQSTSYPFMAVRLLTYVSLLLEEIIRRRS